MDWSHPGERRSSDVERPNSAVGAASRVRLAEWQSRVFPVLRRYRDAATPIDDVLPMDLLADLDETRRVLAELASRGL